MSVATSTVPVAIVRYGRLRQLAELRGEWAMRGRRCLLRTPRGVELGTVVATVERETAPEQAILRMATEEDDEHARGLEARDREDLPRLRTETADAGLRIVASERLFDGMRAVVYYTSQDRVDVPALLPRLEASLEVSVTLQHIGARQRAKVCGGAGVCGRELCCSTFLRKLKPVTMRMARVQGLDLDPRATAGACGRLKCCLRYEQPHYEEHRRGLPRVGWHVEADRLSGTVISVDVLRRKLLVKPGTGRPRVVFADEVTESRRPPRAPLPVAGEGEVDVPAALPAEGVERGWSDLARRLWKRVRERKGKEGVPSGDASGDPPPAPEGDG